MTHAEAAPATHTSVGQPPEPALHLPLQGRWCSVDGCPGRAIGYTRLCLINAPPTLPPISRETYFFCLGHKHEVCTAVREPFREIDVGL